MLKYAQCIDCGYIQPIIDNMVTEFNCSVCDTRNDLAGRFFCSLDGQWVAVSYPEVNTFLSNWDTAIVNLVSDLAEYKNIRLRTCSLHYNEEEQFYHINYKGIEFKPNEVKIVTSWEIKNE